MPNEIAVSIISLVGVLFVSVTSNIVLLMRRNGNQLPSNIVTLDSCSLLCGRLEEKMDSLAKKLDEHIMYHLEMTKGR